MKGKYNAYDFLPYVTVEHEILADNEQCSLVWVISEKDLLIHNGS